MKKILFIFSLTVLCLSCILPANAQDAEPQRNPGEAMFAVKVAKSPSLSEENGKLLLSKIERAMSRCQAAAGVSGNGPFIVRAELNDITSASSEGLVKKVSSIKGELALTACNSFNNAVYYSATIPLSAAGTGSDEQMTQKLISAIKVNDAQFVRFVRNARSAIADYFNAHCDEMVDQARAFASAGGKREALEICLAVPSSAPCFGSALEMIEQLGGSQQPEEKMVAVPVEEPVTVPEPAAVPEPAPVETPAPAAVPAPVAQPAATPAPASYPQPDMYVSDPKWKVEFLGAEYTPVNRNIIISLKVTNNQGFNTSDLYTSLKQAIDTNGGSYSSFETEPKTYISYPDHAPLKVSLIIRNVAQNPGNMAFLKIQIGNTDVELRNVMIK